MADDCVQLRQAVAASMRWRDVPRVYTAEAYDCLTESEKRRVRWAPDPALVERLAIAERYRADVLAHELSAALEFAG